ncbi:uncharacterized protein LAESUDRAFT_724513 [Laetiporus sulphureus 93-53]|uniref:Uncharacterized protein n=1 Tax=Laetiporus sulphureus 93-53 TaxID=1314785 RepID=A0A165EZD4_9APHY|nr:uncharacterized protein LAESUDRAFT_724513 [Laetiporus sulphureus 93-53]KZT08036.1 hypothetical protein LAESUDRAFT_724513 [Laetiporus sulphureus 93-53]
MRVIAHRLHSTTFLAEQQFNDPLSIAASEECRVSGKMGDSDAETLSQVQATALLPRSLMACPPCSHDVHPSGKEAGSGFQAAFEPVTTTKLLHKRKVQSILRVSGTEDCAAAQREALEREKPWTICWGSPTPITRTTRPSKRERTEETRTSNATDCRARTLSRESVVAFSSCKEPKG